MKKKQNEGFLFNPFKSNSDERSSERILAEPLLVYWMNKSGSHKHEIEFHPGVPLMSEWKSWLIEKWKLSPHSAQLLSSPSFLSLVKGKWKSSSIILHYTSFQHTCRCSAFLELSNNGHKERGFWEGSLHCIALDRTHLGMNGKVVSLWFYVMDDRSIRPWTCPVTLSLAFASHSQFIHLPFSIKNKGIVMALRLFLQGKL